MLTPTIIGSHRVTGAGTVAPAAGSAPSSPAPAAIKKGSTPLTDPAPTALNGKSITPNAAPPQPKVSSPTLSTASASGTPAQTAAAMQKAKPLPPLPASASGTPLPAMTNLTSSASGAAMQSGTVAPPPSTLKDQLADGLRTTFETALDVTSKVSDTLGSAFDLPASITDSKALEATGQAFHGVSAGISLAADTLNVVTNGIGAAKSGFDLVKNSQHAGKFAQLNIQYQQKQAEIKGCTDLVKKSQLEAESKVLLAQMRGAIAYDKAKEGGKEALINGSESLFAVTTDAVCVASAVCNTPGLNMATSVLGAVGGGITIGKAAYDMSQASKQHRALSDAQKQVSTSTSAEKREVLQSVAEHAKNSQAAKQIDSVAKITSGTVAITAAAIGGVGAGLALTGAIASTGVGAIVLAGVAAGVGVVGAGIGVGIAIHKLKDSVENKKMEQLVNDPQKLQAEIDNAAKGIKAAHGTAGSGSPGVLSIEQQAKLKVAAQNPFYAVRLLGEMLSDGNPNVKDLAVQFLKQNRNARRADVIYGK
jgi:hypothetical protein